MSQYEELELGRIGLIGTHVPRQCGIATFTDDLARALELRTGSSSEVFAIAMDDHSAEHRYPDRVRFQICADAEQDYETAAEFVASMHATAIILQHEYGIFGGPAGEYILSLLERIRVPIVSTLHTVLADPDPDERRVFDRLATLSDRLIVMCRRASHMLQEYYGIPAERIAVIPHGIPDLPFLDPNYFKDEISAEGRRTVLTFGLLSPNKGIEYMIEAMPKIVARVPDLLYLVVGATHPNLLAESGDSYRESLRERVASLGLREHVRFRNEFVTLDELCRYIGAADLYVTPYLGEAQITSGTLAYAMGAGKAVVSTPYWYAQEMLADGRGELVPFGSAAALTEAVTGLLEDDLRRHQVRKRAYAYCRNMIWSQVAHDYVSVLSDVIAERRHSPRRPARQVPVPDGTRRLPEPDLRHVRAMTDATGILGHAWIATPVRRFGYTVDDNALALAMCAMYDRLSPGEPVDDLMSTYLAFITDAYDADAGLCRHAMTYSRVWDSARLGQEGTGRVLWALGLTAAFGTSQTFSTAAAEQFRRMLSAAFDYIEPRACAYALLGVHAYLQRYQGDAQVRRLRHVLTDVLRNAFQRERCTEDWVWCEDSVGHSAALLPHALIRTGGAVADQSLVHGGLAALEWLCRIQTGATGKLSLIGGSGGFQRGQSKARFDQMPLDAAHLCLACCEAHRVTHDDAWLASATHAVEWFLGSNDLGAELYDRSTGGCCDSLTPNGPNRNMGAEATLSWLIALIGLATHARGWSAADQHQPATDKTSQAQLSLAR